MQFRDGSDVVSADGTKLGEVQRFVVDPSGDEITHLVITKGFFYPDERVIPMNLVSSSDGDTVKLAWSIDLEDLPLFEETHYVTIDPDTSASRYPYTTAKPPLTWSYPAYAGIGVPGSMAYPAYGPYPGHLGLRGETKVTERQVPEGSRVVKTGSTVVSSDGDDVGRVREAVVTEDGVLLGFRVDPGWFKDEQTIPAHFVRTVQDDRVLLAVSSSTLEQMQR